MRLMEVEEARALLEKTESDYSGKQNFFKGLQILAKYDEDIDPSFEHDQIWISEFEETVTKMTPEEVELMGKYGFFEDEDSWSHF